MKDEASKFRTFVRCLKACRIFIQGSDDLKVSRQLMDKHPAKKICVSGKANKYRLAQSILFGGIVIEHKKPAFRLPDAREQSDYSL